MQLLRRAMFKPKARLKLGDPIPTCFTNSSKVIGDTERHISNGAPRACASLWTVISSAVSKGVKRSSKLEAKTSALPKGDLAQVPSGFRTENFGAACLL